MKRNILWSVVWLLTFTSVCAQIYFPPVFGKDTISVRKDNMTRMYIPPKRILWVSNHEIVKNEHVLLLPNTGQAELGGKNMCSMFTNGKDTASIILDYGRELHGGLKLVMGSSSKNEPSLVRIRFGESASETCSEMNNTTPKIGYSTNDHAMRDWTMEIPRDGQIEIGNTGFRFVRIDLIKPDVTIYLKEATAIFRYKNIPYLGSFTCSDERLNQIWMTGAYTVHLNMQEFIWDGIKRDRLIWLGDMHPETSTISTVFGDDNSFYKSLDLACQQFPLPNWLNGMSAYSMWYLIIQYDWYMHNDNLYFLKKHKDYILGVIDRIDGCVEQNGDEHLAEWRFLDWPSSPNTLGVEAGYRALLVWAMQDGEKLCHILKDKAHAAKCVDIANRIKKQHKDPNGLKQAAALMAIAGMMPPEEAANNYLTIGGAKDFSTFYGYYMLEALSMAGKYREAMNIISEYWGGMLDLGATTFWEDFDLAWTQNAARIDELIPKGKKDIHGDFGAYCYPGFRHSFCHGWASGPTAWMTRHILGIEIMKPGCKELRIIPHLGNLTWAEGTFPTPQGIVYVKHIQDGNGKISTTIKAPKGIKIVK